MKTDSKYSKLRKKAELVLKEKGIESAEKYYNDIEKLVEELNVHQIELEMQNQELQLATQRLQTEQKKYINLYENAPIAYFTVNRTGNIYELNNQAAKLLGMPKELFYKTSLFVFLSNDSKYVFTKFFKRVFESKNVEYAEIDLINRNSELIHTKINAQAYFDYDNDKLLCRCAITNITNEIKLREAIDAERNKFKFLTDNSFDIISIISADGTILFDSNSIKNILGYENHERIGQKLYQYLEPYDYKNTLIEYLIPNNSTQIIEFRLLHKNGHWVWVEAISQNCIDNPLINGIIVNSRDITERKEAEIQKNYLSAIIENTENICVIKDLNLKVIAANESFAKVVGKLSVSDLIGKTDAELFGISEAEEPIKSYMADERKAQKLQKGEKILHQEIVVLPDKSMKTVLTTKFPIYDNDNKIIATANISTDITKLKEAEKKIKEQYKELKLLNEDKNRFMQILGHDLRSPFNSILGFSNLLNKNIEKYDQAKIKKIVSIINDVAKNTYNLLNDLILWSKSQSGSLPFEPKEEELINIFKETKQELIYLANNKNIKINYFEENETVLNIDKNMFKTIFRNLLSNAIKFSHKNSNINISCHSENEQVRISFSDKGIGIQANDINKIWDRSKPYTTLGTDNEIGTGLGLLLCKEFVEKHGGEIWVESEYGKGSIFNISIPLIKKNK